jgi:hypothetical protein
LQPSHRGSSPSNPLSFELVARGLASTDEDNVLCCPDCQVPLDLHQPDLAEPMQLLATCGCCTRWFMLVELDLDGSETLLLELPSAESIRLAHAESPLDEASR